MMEPEQDRAVIYRFGKFVLDPRERVFLADGKPVHLADKVFATLVLLVEHNGRLMTKDEMMTAIWDESFVEESNLVKNISRLRKILNTGEVELIETLPKRGYRFFAEVNELESDSSLVLNRNLRVKITQTEEDDGPSLDEAELAAPARSGLMIRGGVGRPRMLLLALGLPSIAVLLIGSIFWNRRPAAETGVAAVDSGPLRLTNVQSDEDGGAWGNDNRIRFARYVTNAGAESFVINPDGSGEQRANGQIEKLRSGNWSPDGTKVIFDKLDGSSSNQFIANDDGSSEMKLPFRVGPVDWSSNASRIVFSCNFFEPENSEIYIYDLEGEKVVNISNSPALDSNPAFSPDGKQVVFNSDRGGKVSNIYLMNADGSNLRRLSDHPSGEAFPVFSPDGTQILFNSLRENEKVGIYLMNVNDSSPPVKVSDTSYNAETRQRPFSPDGTRIVFTSDKDGKKYNTYTMSAEPFRPRLVISSPDSDIGSPAPSPDGKSIVYQARMEDKSGQLCLFDIETQTARVLIKNENADLFPSWSPDGTLIAFDCKIGGNTEICSIRPDGSDLRNLTNDPAHDSHATWSPDGGEIIFCSNRERFSDQYRLFRMSSNGTDPRRITAKNGYEMTPAWSPDGSKVAFSGDRQDGRSDLLDIFLLDLQDPTQEKILAVLPLHDAFPSFSPDGRRIAFVSQRDGNAEIYLVNSDGSGLVRLTRNAAEDTSPAFSTDGRSLFFTSNRSGRFGIYEVELPF